MERIHHTVPCRGRQWTKITEGEKGMAAGMRQACMTASGRGEGAVFERRGAD